MGARFWKPLLLVLAGLFAADLAALLGMAMLGNGRAAVAAKRTALLAEASRGDGAVRGLTARLALGASVLAQAAKAHMTLHPYLGYVGEPEPAHWPAPEGRLVELQSSVDGFADPPAEVEVGLFGASVASGLCTNAGTTLLAELARFPGFSGKRIALRCFGVGGYKQPQQLIALTYAMAVGRNFDLVINVDGVNEIMLPFAENRPAGVFPFYPRRWETLVAGIPDLTRLRFVGAIVDLEDQRVGLAQAFSHAPLRYSAICNLLWQALDQRLATKLSEVRAALERTAPPDRSAFLGPKRAYPSDDLFFEDLAATWKRSSIEMASLCAATGSRYYHFLDPCLANRDVALARPHEEDIEKGYPLLIKAGRELVASGVDFLDAGTAFANVDERLYADKSCHLNRRGSEILGAWMAARIVQDLSRVGDHQLTPAAGTDPSANRRVSYFHRW